MFGIARLFMDTIGRRMLLVSIGRAPPEVLDADGNYQTLVAQRAKHDAALEQSDFDAVHRGMVNRGEIPSLARALLVPVALLAIMLALSVYLFAIAGFRGLAFPVFPLFVGGMIFWSQWSTQKNTLKAPEQQIARAWLNQGCCPHCAYRFPAPGSEPILQCSECGVRWNRHSPPRTGSTGLV